MSKKKWKKKFGESLTFLMYNRCQILTTIQCVEKVLPEILKEEREKMAKALRKDRYERQTGSIVADVYLKGHNDAIRAVDTAIDNYLKEKI